VNLKFRPADFGGGAGREAGTTIVEGIQPGASESMMEVGFVGKTMILGDGVMVFSCWKKKLKR
jgi:hypothetical protein